MSLVRTVVQIMWVPVVLALLYLGWVFWQRHSEPAPQQGAAKAVLDPLEKYGSDVKILQFYTNPGAIARGEKALICYGVVNAASVRLEPAVESVWPAVSRCFETAPRQTTRFTLTAESADHKTVSESIEIAVR